jgi:hypothetical protein
MIDSVNPRSNREHLEPQAPIPGEASRLTEATAASSDAFLSNGLSLGQSGEAPIG